MNDAVVGQKYIALNIFFSIMHKTNKLEPTAFIKLKYFHEILFHHQGTEKQLTVAVTPHQIFTQTRKRYFDKH